MISSAVFAETAYATFYRARVTGTYNLANSFPASVTVRAPDKRCSIMVHEDKLRAPKYYSIHRAKIYQESAAGGRSFVGWERAGSGPSLHFFQMSAFNKSN